MGLVPGNANIIGLCRSDEHGHTALGNLANKKEIERLDRSIFSRAPREVMAGTLVRLRYATLLELSHVSIPYTVVLPKEGQVTRNASFLGTPLGPKTV
jgi:hypothetical protein